MTAGYLQLVAKGAQDLWLTNDPEITMFKTVYRRHTLFSKCELDMHFTGTPDFGNTVQCKIQNLGDLLHRLFLTTKLPAVEMTIKPMTCRQIRDVLYDDYNITWTNYDTKLDTSRYNNTTHQKVVPVVLQHKAKLEAQLNLLNNLPVNMSKQDTIRAVLDQHQLLSIYDHITTLIASTPDQPLTNADIIVNTLNKPPLTSTAKSNREYIDYQDPDTDQHLDIYKLNRLYNNTDTATDAHLSSIDLLKKLITTKDEPHHMFIFYDQTSDTYVVSPLVNHKISQHKDPLQQQLECTTDHPFNQHVQKHLKIFHKTCQKWINQEDNKAAIQEIKLTTKLNDTPYQLNLDLAEKLLSCIGDKDDTLVKHINQTTTNIRTAFNKRCTIDTKHESYMYIALNSQELDSDFVINSYYDVVKSHTTLHTLSSKLTDTITNYCNTNTTYIFWRNLELVHTTAYQTFINNVLNPDKVREISGSELAYYTANPQICLNRVLQNWHTSLNTKTDISLPTHEFYYETTSQISAYLADSYDTALPPDTPHTPMDVISSINTDMFSHLTSRSLYADKSKIDSSYNSFTKTSDVYHYLQDLIINTTFLKDLTHHTTESLQDHLQKTTDKLHIDILNLTDYSTSTSQHHTGLISKLARAAACTEEQQLSDFAWIEHIGHFLIEYVSVRINDQEIDRHTGEWLHLLHQRTKKDTKERGYNKLIGNVPELTTYNSRPKPEYYLTTPLKFWFCKYLGESLPLVALLHSEVVVTVKYRSFKEVAYYDKFASFNKRPKLEASMLGEFVYVDFEERERIANNNLEYMIDQVNYNGDVLITDNVQRLSGECDEDTACDPGYLVTTVEERLYYENSCKGITWVMQRSDFVDGSLNNGQMLYHNYSFDLENRTNPADSAKIRFSGSDRELYKKINYYNYVEPDKHNYSTPSAGINSYFFAYHPDDNQPSGAANLSSYDDVSVVVRLNNKTRELLEDKSKRVHLRWGIYVHRINMLRIAGGLAGLTFF